VKIWLILLCLILLSGCLNEEKAYIERKGEAGADLLEPILTCNCSEYYEDGYRDGFVDALTK